MNSDLTQQENILEIMTCLSELTKDTDLNEVKQHIRLFIDQLNCSNNDITDLNMLISYADDTVVLLKTAFNNRYQQFQCDLDIVKQINFQIDSFRDTHNRNIQTLIGELTKEVNLEIDNYKVEIIQKLAPHRINSFADKGEFEHWLMVVNENHKSIMNRNIERKIQQAIKSYLWEIEKVFINVLALLEERPIYLDLENHVYGTLSKSKANIVISTKNHIIQTRASNHSLTTASGEYFDKVWKEKKEYDNKVLATSIAGGATGGATGGVTAFALAATKAAGSVAAALGAGSGPALSGAALLGVVGVGLLGAGAGALLLYDISKKAAAAGFNDAMMKKVDQHREKFSADIETIKQEVDNELSKSVTLVFDDELRNMDRTFMKFRALTHIDEKNLPYLQKRLETVEILLETQRNYDRGEINERNKYQTATE